MTAFNEPDQKWREEVAAETMKDGASGKGHAFECRPRCGRAKSMRRNTLGCAHSLSCSLEFFAFALRRVESVALGCKYLSYTTCHRRLNHRAHSCTIVLRARACVCVCVFTDDASLPKRGRAIAHELIDRVCMCVCVSTGHRWQPKQ